MQNYNKKLETTSHKTIGPNIMSQSLSPKLQGQKHNKAQNIIPKIIH